MDEFDLSLPKGATCGACVNYQRCEALINQKHQSTSCDFYPIRYRRKIRPFVTVILEMTRHYCSSGGRVDSMGVEAAADAILALEAYGVVQIEKRDGNRVVGKIVKEEWERWRKHTQKW